MAIPSGSGSEVLRHFGVDANNTAECKVDFGSTTGTGTVRSSGNTAGVVTVPANVIITVLNINCSANAGTHDINCKIDWANSGTDITVFLQSGLVSGTTFIYNERIVLREGDNLLLFNSASSCDWTVNFIYQDWT